MKPSNTVAIVGVGMIGGSIGLALRERKLAKRIIGIGRRAATLQRAIEVGAITDGSLNLEEAVAEADVIVVATPVAQLAEQIRRCAEFAPLKALITDAGSTKAVLVRELDEALPAKTRFVGSHPLAGSEKTGPESALPDLFAGRLVIVTPTRRTRPDTVRDAAAFWTALGADVITMKPEAHDEALAEVSHLPHLLAAVIAQSTPKAHLPIAASGWRDTTRIAAGDAQLWTEILLDNRPNVLKSLARFEKTLAGVRAALERGDSAALQRLLAAAKRNRDAVGS
jgi:prephenate dehydrogenase